ncbi:hypothetical protein [Gloeocapsa sp. PCC 73106]|uniref:hypothetical protein n=1 Tax=Gloeocapsa sp. PCC 73106 TaxID=102232 RepID=UPI0002AC1CD3|nr:hypothetical protein [Gloeocapsa sp. PCC 73106]ELS00140.1 hypothetical protein GLO73106DRAFT_00039950 [Gloeocapsa sp. PCC 73106]
MILDLLLNIYNYGAVFSLLEDYFKADTRGWSSTPKIIQAGIAWQKGQFNSFYKLAKDGLNPQQKIQGETYWWMAYEQAYTAIIRLNQNNTTEAMLHSFRSVEGLLLEWVKNKFSQYINETKNNYYLKDTILSKFPNLNSDFQGRYNIELKRWVQVKLIEANMPIICQNRDFQAWNSKECQDLRNRFSHRLGGIDEKELFEAWGNDINNESNWKKRVLNCLNAITQQNFSSLEQASLFYPIHHKVQEKIKEYQPSNIKFG